MDAALEAEVASRALAERLLAPGDVVLAAASGGADSAALAALLVAGASHGLPLRVVLGHVEHGWRGPTEAAADRDVVDRLGALLGVPVRHAEAPEIVRRTEDDARRHRYRALARLAEDVEARVVATAHHLGDQAETFLLRLERGSGPQGLAGIPASRPLAGGALRVVRPVLHVDPARLRDYAEARGLPWRDDPTNRDLSRDRARIRARLAALGERKSALTRDLAEAAARFARAVARREAAVAERLAPSKEVHVEAGAVEVALLDALALPLEETSALLRHLGRDLDADAEGPWFTRRHAELSAALLHGDAAHGVVNLPRGLVLVRTGARLLLARRQVPPLPSARLAVHDGAEAQAGAFHVRAALLAPTAFDADAWRAERRAHPPRTSSPWTAALDADEVGPVLEIRAATPEDAFIPLGRTEPVSVVEFLARASCPEWIRRGTRVAVTARGGIAWVLGHRIDAGTAVGAGTRRVLRLDARTEASR